MRKVIIFLSIVMVAYFSSFTSFAGPVLSIKIEFGKKSCGCCGFGICHVGASIELNNDNDLPVSDGGALGTLTIENGRALFTLSKESMSPETLLKYFGSVYFTVDETYILPEEIIKQLQIKSLEIPKGRYKIIDQGKNFVVKF